MRNFILFSFVVLLLVPCAYAVSNSYVIEGEGLTMQWNTPETLFLNESLRIDLKLSAAETLYDVYVSFMVVGSLNNGTSPYARIYYVMSKPDDSMYAVETNIDNPLIYGFPLKGNKVFDEVKVNDVMANAFSVALPAGFDSGPVYLYVGAAWKVGRGIWMFATRDDRSVSTFLLAGYVGDLRLALDYSTVYAENLKALLLIANGQLEGVQEALDDSLAAYESLLGNYSVIEAKYNALLGLPVPSVTNQTTTIVSNETGVIAAVNSLRTMIANLKLPDLSNIQNYSGTLTLLWVLMGATLIVVVISALYSVKRWKSLDESSK